MRSSGIGIVAAGLLCLNAASAGSAWGAAGFGVGQTLDVDDFLTEAKANAAPENPRMIQAGYIIANDPQAGKPDVPVEWIPISGGKFMMGTDNGGDNARRIREVGIKTFEISKTLVTVEQYAECVVKRRCIAPGAGEHCNSGHPDRKRHPVNCVDWEDAQQYAKFAGARLPSESEWEYAGTSGGMNHKYPWGNEPATCERAVMYGNGGFGCGGGTTMPVCSKPAGSTAQGLCDMAGNVWQWVRDMHRSSYANAPVDGGAVEGDGLLRVMRGGSFNTVLVDSLRADFRNGGFARTRYVDVGFRLARSSR